MRLSDALDELRSVGKDQAERCLSLYIEYLKEAEKCCELGITGRQVRSSAAPR